MTDALHNLSARQGGVVTLQQARTCGYSLDEIDALCAKGRWTSIRRGVYLLGAAPLPEAEPIRRHVIDAAAALLAIDAGNALVADISAAALWGLDFIQKKPLFPEVRLARPKPCGTKLYPGLRVCPATLPEHHVTHGPGGLRTCTPARVVVDLARHRPTREAVVFGDSALRKRLATRTELDLVLADCAGWPGARHAARVLAQLDERAESVAESLARLGLIAGGVTDFESQVEIRDAQGRKVARVDFLVCRRVAVEPDGRVKYTDPDALWKEKLREDAIRELGYEVVRLTWAEVERVDHVRRKVQAALDRSMKRFPDPPGRVKPDRPPSGARDSPGRRATKPPQCREGVT